MTLILDTMQQQLSELVEDVLQLKAEYSVLITERDALKAKLEEGIRVLVLTDSIGKHTIFNSSAPNATLILDEGVIL